MPIDITCPQCAARYRVPDQLAGKKARCKRCQSSIEIPVALTDDPPALTDHVIPTPGHTPAPAPAPALDYGRPKRRGPSEVLIFSDQIHRWISFGLILIWAGFVVWSVHDTLRFVNEFIPQGLIWRFYTLVTLTFLWIAFIVGGLIAPGILAACRFSGEWTGGDMPNDSYLRSCGAAAVVAILTVLVGRMILIRYGFSRHFWDEVFKDGEVVSLSIAAPLILAVAIRATLGRSWPATFIIEGLCFVIVFLVGTGLRYANEPVQKAMLSIARLTPEDIAQYHKDHPEDMPAFTRRPPGLPSGAPSVPGSRSTPGYNPAPPAPPAPDPLEGKMDDIMDRLHQLDLAANTGTREQLRPQYDQLQKDLTAMLPKEQSMLYNRAKRQLSTVNEKIQAAPSEKPPADLTTPVTRPLAISRSSDDLFGTAQYRFADLTIKQLKSARIDVSSYPTRNKTLKWKFADEREPAGQITIQPLLDDGKQQRPWVIDRPILEQLAAKQNLFTVKAPRDAEVTSGEINGVGWTRITPKDTSTGGTETRRAIYVARLSSSWAIVTLTAAWPHPEYAQARGDALIQGIRPAKPDDTTRTAFDPTFVVEEYSGTWHDDPAPILREAGQDGINALRDYLAKHNGAYDAERLLRELTQQRIDNAERRTLTGAAPKPLEIDIDSALKRIDSGNTFDRAAAFKELSLAKVDESKRDAVAEVLEGKFTTAGFSSEIEPIGKALEVWWRPQTVVAMLPFLEEKADRWKRPVAMRVLAATKDKKAVYPILRWLIKEPEEVVKDLKLMGPVAEDEVTKLLRDRNNEVRRNAARILEEIGTQKSLLELRRASTDPRDASAAAAAKLAVESVMNRTKQQKPATTRAAS